MSEEYFQNASWTALADHSGDRAEINLNSTRSVCPKAASRAACRRSPSRVLVAGCCGGIGLLSVMILALIVSGNISSAAATNNFFTQGTQLTAARSSNGSIHSARSHARIALPA